MSRIPPIPDPLIAAVPAPGTVRRWLAQALRRAALLRSLLRLAERKAACRRRRLRQPKGGAA